MGKMGRINLSIQEVVNELGYDSVSEALNDGLSSTQLMSMRDKYYG